MIERLDFFNRILANLSACHTIFGDLKLDESIGDLSCVVTEVSSVAVATRTFFSVSYIIDRLVEVSPDYKRVDFPVKKPGHS